MEADHPGNGVLIARLSTLELQPAKSKSGGEWPPLTVIRSLDRIIEWRGKPGTIRVDNGPEYVSGKLMEWAEKKGHRHPARPTGPAQAERLYRVLQPYRSA